jgi:hypothetical protein
LLGDHLNLQLLATRHDDRRGAASRPGAVFLQAHRAVRRERQHENGRDHDPSRLQTLIAAKRRAFQHAALRLAKGDRGVDEIEHDEQQHRRCHRQQHGVVGDMPGGL